jgi:hypothetical protein
MIAPTKHITLDGSLIGVGATLLKQLAEPRTITALWESSRQIPSVRTFQRFVLALDLLYIVGAIELVGESVIQKVKS